MFIKIENISRLNFIRIKILNERNVSLRVFPFSSSLFWRLPIVCDPKEVNNGDPSVMTRENQDVKKSSRTKGVEQGKGRQPAKYSYRLKIVEIK